MIARRLVLAIAILAMAIAGAWARGFLMAGVSGSSGVPLIDGFLLLENGSFLLLEGGGKICLEGKVGC